MERKFDSENHQLLNLKNFVVQELIGRGSFGKVYKVIEKKTNQIYAAKVSLKKIDDDSSEANKSIIDKIKSSFHFDL